MSGSTYNIKAKRIRTFILGKDSPALFTRIIFFIVLPVLFWYLFFYLLELLAIRLVETMPNAEAIRMSLDKVAATYSIQDIQGVFFRMALTGLFGVALIASGMILMWRRRISGYPMQAAGLLICMTAPWLFFGYEYYLQEQTFADYLIPAIPLVLVLIDWMRRARTT